MSGNSSCTRNIKIALEFAHKTSEECEDDQMPVIFVISCQNYDAFPGFRLNNQEYTAYPHEEEILLSEGCPALILHIEKDFKLSNPHDHFKEFQGKSMTLIHMYLPDYNFDRLKNLE